MGNFSFVYCHDLKYSCVSPQFLLWKMYVTSFWQHVLRDLVVSLNLCTLPWDWEYLDLSEFLLTFLPKVGNSQASEMLLFFLCCSCSLHLEHWTESKVQKLINSKCNIPWSEPYRIKVTLVFIEFFDRNWIVTDYSLHKCALIKDAIFLLLVPVRCLGFCTYSIGLMLSLHSIHMKCLHVNNMPNVLAW